MTPSPTDHPGDGELTCPYCRSRDVDIDSPDHVVPRSCGGGLVVESCAKCNTDANHDIDQAILRNPDLLRLRAEAGVIDQRTGKPVSYQETIAAADGKRALLRWSEDGPAEAKYLPVPIPRPDGDIDIFTDPEFAAEDEHGEVPDPATLEHPPGSHLEVLMTTRPHGVPPWLWPSLAARIALGAVRRGLLSGLIDSEPKPLMARLSALARDATISLDMWDTEDIATMPSPPPAGDPLLGAFRRAEHLIYVGPRDPGDDVNVLRLVLFGARLYELALPGIHVPDGAVWLLDAQTQKVAEGTTAEILEKLRVPTPAQLAFSAGRPS